MTRDIDYLDNLASNYQDFRLVSYAKSFALIMLPINDSRIMYVKSPWPNPPFGHEARRASQLVIHMQHGQFFRRISGARSYHFEKLLISSCQLTRNPISYLR
ncbi:hypothetical protein QL093DRAFT_2429006 [Fusarium oxysporum]|nr:hypothetical protein QL093DRAFT_2429006 [Fusarium oxysporum]